MSDPLSQKQEPMYDSPCSSRETPISVLISPFRSDRRLIQPCLCNKHSLDISRVLVEGREKASSVRCIGGFDKQSLAVVKEEPVMQRCKKNNVGWIHEERGVTYHRPEINRTSVPVGGPL